MSEQNKEIVDQANAFVRENNVDGFLSLFAGDAIWTLLAETPSTINGRDGIRDFMASTTTDGAAPPDFTVDNLIAEGDIVMANGEMTMTGKDGETVPYAYCDIYRFEAGKIAELRTFLNKTQAESAKESSAAV